MERDEVLLFMQEISNAIGDRRLDAGSRHIHATGEIGAIMPLSGAPEFDGKSKGWYVYPAGCDHHPTVTGGEPIFYTCLPAGKLNLPVNR